MKGCSGNFDLEAATRRFGITATQKCVLGVKDAHRGTTVRVREDYYLQVLLNAVPSCSHRRVMLKFETILWNQRLTHVAGIDEVGRGALAGPVVAAAVIFPPNLIIDGVRDSKLLRKHAREDILKKIRETAIDLGIGYASPSEIDALNIVKASLLAMQRALDALNCTPQALLIDGNQYLPNASCPQLVLVKGDRRSHSIAAASIAAKVTRDHLMQELHDECPEYGWDRNVGYPTKGHYTALHETGSSTHHRQTFRLR